jgi:stage V sporulation protein B
LSLRRQTFLQGAVILLAAGIVNRLLGFVPRIALPRMIGAEGVGLIQLVYPFLIVVLTIITGGLPLAVAKLVAEAEARGDELRVRRVLHTAITLAGLTGLAGAIACYALSDWVSGTLMTDSRVHDAFVTMLPMLPIVAVSSVWRGYFQGRHNMIPSAVSQTTETVVRIVLTLVFAWLFLPWGLERAAAGAMLGMVAGEAAGFLVLWNWMRKERLQEHPDGDSGRDAPAGEPPSPEGARSGEAAAPPVARFSFRIAPPDIIRRMLAIAAPVTGSRMIGSLSYLLESILTARSLAAAGVATALATAQYGALQGMVVPLLALPGALTYSLAVSLVPSLAEAATRNDGATIRKRLHQSLRLAVAAGAPFSMLMGVLAEPLCQLLYGQSDMAGLLRLLAPLSVFLYMQPPLQAALQALDRPGVALLNSFAGAAVKLTLIVQLASNPRFGIVGAAMAIGINMALVTVLHWVSVARLTGLRLHPLDFLKIGAAVTVTGAAALWIWNLDALSADILNLAAAGGAAASLYVLLLVPLGLIDRHDAARLPLIGRLFR